MKIYASFFEHQLTLFRKRVNVKLVYTNTSWIVFDFRLSRNQSNAGFNLQAGIFGYEYHFSITDPREWDYDNNKWKDSEHARYRQSGLQP